MDDKMRSGDREIARRHFERWAQIDPALVLAGLTTATPQDYFDWVTDFVVATTAADVAYVAQIIGAGGESLRTAALCAEGERLPPREFESAGTVASVALREGSYTLQSGVGAHYATDAIVRQFDIESVVGAGLASRSGRPVGVLVAFSRTPLDDEATVELVNVMEVLRERLATVMRSNRRQSELNDVLDASAAVSAEETLVALTRVLASALRVKSAFVVELQDADHGLAKSLALVVDGESLPNMNFAIAGTPSETVFAEGVLHHAQDACSQYEEVGFLRELGVDGYLAVVLRCPHGKPIASLGIMHDGPVDAAIRDSALFQVCVSVATSEVIRVREARKRLNLERELLATQRAESLGLLAGGVAHDFRNILTSIGGTIDLAAGQLPLDSPLHERMREVRRATERATLLCSQLLAYAGKGQMTRRVVDLDHLIEDMGELLGVSVAANCSIELDLADPLPAVEGDIAQLQQIVMNLLTNASEATGRKGGVVRVRTAVVDELPATTGHVIRPSEPHVGAHVLLEVRDDGCGIDADHLPSIFEPFFSTKSGASGRGLGLAALSGIVRGHGGTVHVESARDEGTTFRVFLPASPLTAPPRGWPQQPRAHAAVTATVLVVDDEPTTRALAETMLVQAGFEVLLASDGEQAMAEIDEHGDEIGCIVLDLVMPRMDGTEVIQALKSHGSAIPIVLSSGFPPDFLADRFDPADVAAVLSKPYTLQQLVETVDSVLVGVDA